MSCVSAADPPSLLQALISDLGLNSCSKYFVHQLCDGPLHTEPLTEAGEITNPDKIALSTGGCVCLVAYWVFSATVFEAMQPRPEMYIFPEHFAVLDKFLQDDAHGQIQRSAGTVEALVAIGLWLQSNGLVSANPTSPLTNPTTSPEDPTSDYMRYVHLATLIAVYHPQLQARNAASVLAGRVLHSDPSDDDRLKILYDLLENCMYASLKARAVAWLREELISAASSTTTSSSTSRKQPPPNLFATPQALETVQYAVFPSLASLLDEPTPDLVQYLAANAVFLLQAVNFALFLWGSQPSSSSGSSSNDNNENTAAASEPAENSNRWRHVLPANMDATVRERWFEPLREMLGRVERDAAAGELRADVELDGPLRAELAVLAERLALLGGADGFRARS